MIKKSFNAQLASAGSPITIDAGTSILNITHTAGGTGTVTVTDMDNLLTPLNSFTMTAGESITLSWGFTNSQIKIECTGNSTARMIYYE